ncbi:hexosyltransferase [Alteromonas sp. KUL42]|uniref:glycosyltransferase family 4 protein n=1 Tax=Alteromonas sp. KUL42 TaxID=2480797 RepID=UPI00103596BA|nr:glycosyltransferase family 4 protein [Alteromonas sp. KUL42]TAP33476.1 glycosyltransferase [Alteromonas sp. KUL42]GEA08341.1 hexosyltransferase [Alteromonas sp. KUL42]
MNLLFVLPGGVHPSGETDVIPVLLNLLEALESRHRVFVVALHQHWQLTEYKLSGAQIISLPMVRTSNLFSSAATVFKRMKHYNFRPDVVHGFWLGKPVVLGALLAKRFRVPLFASVAGGELINLADINYGGHRSYSARFLNWLSLKLADEISCGSVYLQEILRKRKVNAQLVPLGIDDDFWPLKAIASDKIEKWQLIQVASINQVKDPWLLLDILRALKNAAFNFQFHWVGEDTLAGRVQQKAAQEGLEGFIEFHGFKTQTQLKAMLQNKHFIIQTSRYESQGVAMMEACRRGLCPVGTNVGWLYDLALGNTAPRDQLGQKIASQIVMLANDFTQRQQRVEIAQKWLIANDLNMTVQRFEQKWSAY